MSAKKLEFHFEKSLADLEHLVEKMERGEFSLEEALKQFERGVALVRSCQQALREAEHKVQILTSDGSSASLTDFPVPDISENV